MEDFCRRTGTIADAPKVAHLIGETFWIGDESACKSKVYY